LTIHWQSPNDTIHHNQSLESGNGHGHGTPFIIERSPILLAPANILKVVLQINQLAGPITYLCIKCIQTGVIYGRNAIYCISEIRLHIISLRIPKRKIADDVSQLITSDDDTIDFLNGVVKLCTNPLEVDDWEDISTAILCLDLIPTCMMAISSLRTLTIQSRNNDLTSSKLYLNEIISTSFDSVKWNKETLLPLMNLLCDVYMYCSQQQILILMVRARYSKKQFIKIVCYPFNDFLIFFLLYLHQKRLVSTVLSFCEETYDDFAGIVRVCLILMEQR
jgi:hypothetical protein